MSSHTPQELKWSAQFSLSSVKKLLQGDKIILPPSALEALLSASTTIVPVDAPPQGLTGTFDSFNPHSYAAERQLRSQISERQQNLPHPLTFRLVNPVNGLVAYAGVREFSAEEGEVNLSLFLQQALRIEKAKDADEAISSDLDTNIEAKPDMRITVHAQQIPKGTYVRFRPLEAGYDPEDWKSLLENYMRDTFTTLTNGEILTVPFRKEEFRFLVDKLGPEGDAICIVDTDLEVDIEALNEEQARETLKRRLKKSERSLQNADGNSAGGDLVLGKPETGQVQSGHYVDYTIRDWDRSRSIAIEVGDMDTESIADIFVSPLSSRQRARPRLNEHIFSDIYGRPTKRIRIQPSNTELENAEAIYVSVFRYEDADSIESSSSSTKTLQYSITVSNFDRSAPPSDADIKLTDEPPTPEDTKCKNCQQWVPKRTLFLHENFCFRNNILCPKCKEVFQKSSSEWKNHWHCPNDSSHGTSSTTHQKHNALHHTPTTCSHCNYQAPTILSLAHHRTTTCPAKHILCQFCHLVVPQQGPDDLDLSDPEVILSGLTPHELSDGSRTTECHLCGKITRLRDMSTHLRHHDLERRSRSPPRICRNVNCGRTLDGIGSHGEIKRPHPLNNDLGVCETCFGPLYNSSFDPDGRALRRRVERRYLSQLITGCGKDWCRNAYCKTGRKALGHGESVTSKDAGVMTKPALEGMMDWGRALHFCTDEGSQRRRVLAELIAAEEEGEEGVRSRYDVLWCVAAMEVEGGDLAKGRTWLANWAVKKGEERGK
ncbi:hypothetical protein MMC14_009932 [Varicellaria rhodocarpa]|nr:hypothetical protein [Varicellaria rhodocarpa]